MKVFILLIEQERLMDLVMKFIAEVLSEIETKREISMSCVSSDHDVGEPKCDMAIIDVSSENGKEEARKALMELKIPVVMVGTLPPKEEIFQVSPYANPPRLFVSRTSYVTDMRIALKQVFGFVTKKREADASRRLAMAFLKQSDMQLN